MKFLIITLLFLLTSCNEDEQKFKVHEVKSGLTYIRKFPMGMSVGDTVYCPGLGRVVLDSLLEPTPVKQPVVLSRATTTVYCPEKGIEGEIPTELINSLERSTKRTYTGCELMEIFITVDTTHK